MKLIVVDDRHHNFLLHVFETYTRNGIATTELAIATETFQRLEHTREVPPLPEDIHIGKAQLTDVGPNGVTLEVPLAPE